MPTIIYGAHGSWGAIIDAFSTVACEILVFMFCNRMYEASYFPKAFQKSIDNRKNMRIFAKLFTFMLCVLSIFIISAAADKATPYISKLFLGSEENGYFANIFIVPVIAFFLSLILRIHPTEFTDITALCSSASLVIFKISCSVSGCCYGVEYSGRFYNESNDAYEVPVQLIELACAVVMFAMLITLFKKRKISGFLFPLFMIMYCSSRFVSEFWRGDYPDVLGRLKGYHIMCIIGFGLGVFYMLIGIIFGKKINKLIQKNNDAFLKKMEIKFPIWKKNHPQLWEIAKYQIAGVVASGFELIVHMMLLNIIFYNLSYIPLKNPVLNAIGIRSIGFFISFSVSTAVGYAVGFVLSKKVVFRSDADTKSSMIKYLFLVIFTIFASGYIGTELLKYAQSIHFTGLIEDVIVKIITMLIPFIWVYPINKYVVHRDLNKKK